MVQLPQEAATNVTLWIATQLYWPNHYIVLQIFLPRPSALADMSFILWLCLFWRCICTPLLGWLAVTVLADDWHVANRGGLVHSLPRNNVTGPDLREIW